MIFTSEVMVNISENISGSHCLLHNKTNRKKLCYKLSNAAFINSL